MDNGGIASPGAGEHDATAAHAMQGNDGGLEGAADVAGVEPSVNECTPPAVRMFAQLRPSLAVQAPRCRRPIRKARRQEDPTTYDDNIQVQFFANHPGREDSQDSKDSKDSSKQHPRSQDADPVQERAGSAQSLAPELTAVLVDMCQAYVLAPAPCIVEGELMQLDAERASHASRASRACGL